MIDDRSLISLCTLALVPALMAGAGCAGKNKGMSNEDLYHQYDDNKYSEDIVAAEADANYGEADKGISPRTLANIEDTIDVTYKTDFEHCFEEEMERMETRWLAGQISVEFDIGTDGTVSEAKVLSEDLRERKTPEGGELQGEGRKAEGFDACLEKKVHDWEFDPPPEVEYTHTYSVQLGEAW